jgi:hypothetical protein
MLWQFIVFGHNEHEIPVALAMAEERCMEFRTNLSDSAFNCGMTRRSIAMEKLVAETSGVILAEAYVTLPAAFHEPSCVKSTC